MKQDLVTLVSEKAEVVPEPPEDWAGSVPEWCINWALLRLGLEGQFDYQSSMMGGRLEKGGVILDFYLPGYNLGISVMGEYWHLGRGLDVRASDAFQRAQVESMGVTVVNIKESHALANPIHYVNEALHGRDHSKAA